MVGDHNTVHHDTTKNEVARPCRILLAGSEMTCLRAIARSLQEEGLLCDGAPTVDQALAALVNRPYDILIADIDMPGNQEFQLVRAAHRGEISTRVMVITGKPTVSTAIQSLRLGVVDYQIKPVDLPTVVNSVKAIVRRQKQACPGHKPSWALEDFLGQAVQQVGQIALSLNELCTMAKHGHLAQPAEMCAGLRCPRLAAYAGGLQATIDVLQKTKNAFKSKDLGKLRVELEALLK
jgi:DNA-binding response OmpR family regulator